MELQIAVNLIEKGVTSKVNQRWVDLGAGTGLFTHALAQLLAGGHITAIDRNPESLKTIKWQYPEITLQKIIRELDAFPWATGYDGILMANALHFIDDCSGYLTKIKPALLPGGRIIIVEYDTDAANAWVPFPVSFHTLQTHATASGFSEIEKIGHVQSQYQAQGIYAALLKA